MRYTREFKSISQGLMGSNTKRTTAANLGHCPVSRGSNKLHHLWWKPEIWKSIKPSGSFSSVISVKSHMAPESHMQILGTGYWQRTGIIILTMKKAGFGSEGKSQRSWCVHAIERATREFIRTSEKASSNQALTEMICTELLLLFKSVLHQAQSDVSRSAERTDSTWKELI